MKRSNLRETLFLGWDKPLLPAAASLVCERFESGGTIDLGQIVCALPTALAAKRFAALVDAHAAGRKAAYQRPLVVTVGDLAQRLYRSESPHASELEQTLAWAAVLEQSDPDDLKPLIPTAADGFDERIDLGGILRHLHDDLSANHLTFARVATEAETDTQRRRWQVLSELFDRYQRELAAAELTDPHVALAGALAQGRCHSDQTIVLVGTSDMNLATTAALRALDSPVIALIAAPESESDRFDEFGNIRSDRWLDHQLPLSDNQFWTAGDIAEQARNVARAVEEFRGQQSLGDIVVGVTDESQVAPVEVELRGCGLSPYRHLGWTFAQSAVGRLMNLAIDHLQQPSWQTLAALVRHGDVYQLVEKHLGEQHSNWLTLLDELLSRHFPVDLRGPLPAKAASLATAATRLVEVVDALLAPFRGPPRRLSEWSTAVSEFWQQIYGDPLDQADPTRTVRALQAAEPRLGGFAELNPRLDPILTGAKAVELLTERLSDVRFGVDLQTDDVQIMGWLDLALETAPALVVVGLNHPFVPQAVTADPFLPGALRTKLKMADNDRRFARDLYAAQLMLSTRTEVRLIVGRQSADGSPTPPSRLIAAAPPADLPRRVRMLLDHQQPAPPAPSAHRWDLGPTVTDLPVPPIRAAESPIWPITSMRVTAFRDYLTCPYRFYLRHILKFRPLDDDVHELAANQFGDLVHDTLERYGKSDDRDESDPVRIEKRLTEFLHEVAKENFGAPSTANVALQVAQAEKRLAVLARRQAERVAEGWRIHDVEMQVNEQMGACIEVDGERMFIRGRIDRVDVHPDTGRWAILDYKTNGDPPAKKHLKRSRPDQPWIDLQLPLYRRMAPFLGIDADPAEIELGYFNISQKDAETKINLAEFDQDLLSGADVLIEQIIRDIWAGRFEPTEEPVLYDDYAMILQTGVAARLVSSPADAEG